jgi:hypothetical protein
MLTDLGNKFLMNISKKTQSGLDLSRPGLICWVVGPLRPGVRGRGDLNHLIGGAQPPGAAGAEAVWSALSRPIKSGSTAPGCLLPPAAGTQGQNPSSTGRRRSSPRGLLRPWGGDEGTRLDRTTSERGGSGGCYSCDGARKELWRLVDVGAVCPCAW